MARTMECRRCLRWFKGTCHRYPKAIKTDADHFCAEFECDCGDYGSQEEVAAKKCSCCGAVFVETDFGFFVKMKEDG